MCWLHAASLYLDVLLMTGVLSADKIALLLLLLQVVLLLNLCLRHPWHLLTRPRQMR
jgi:hypothetical protein